jgi:hypothetical protein
VQGSVAVPGPIGVVIRVHAGTALLVAEPGATSVAVDARPRQESDAGQAAVAAATAIEALAGDAARVRVEVPEARQRRQPPVDVRVTFPAGSAVEVHSDTAQVVSRGRLASLAGRLATGDLHLDEVSGTVDVRTTAGSVTLLRAGGDVAVRGGTGLVVVRRSEGTARFATTSGDVDVWYATGDVRATTRAGRVRVGVPLDVEVELTADSVSGRVDPAPAPVDAPTGRLAVSATTVSGDITVTRTVPPRT